MVMTTVKIIKYKERINSCEFYAGFEVDYIELSSILLRKRDFEEAATLIEDAIAGATDPSVEQIINNRSRVHDLKLQMSEIILSDPKRPAEDAFDLIESLKSESQSEKKEAE